MTYISPYRNIFAEPTRKEECYRDINVSTAQIDSNMLAANAQFVAIPWEGTGGGSFCVLPVQNVQNGISVGSKAPLLSGHKAPVIDVAFNPYDDFVIASAADDATIRIWNIEQDSPTSVKASKESAATLTGHSRKVCRIAWNPVVANTIASFGAENSVKLWDVKHGAAALSIKGPTQQFFDVAWSQDGNRVVLPCKDRKVHIYDIRSSQETLTFAGHHGMKGSRAIFDSALNYVVTTGFGQNAARQIALWDERNPEKALQSHDADFNSGVLIPFLDTDLHIVYTFARGDCQCQYYELTTNATPLVPLSTFQNRDAYKAIALAPKYAVDTGRCEVDRFWVVTADKALHHFPMIVPRRGAEEFQEDLYPPTNSNEAPIDFEAWKGGANAEPKKISLKDGVKLAGGSKFVVEDPATAALRAELDAAHKTIDELKAKIADLEAKLAAKE